MIWTKVMNEELGDLLLVQKVRFRQVAQHFGCTKNAAIGAAHRIGIMVGKKGGGGAGGRPKKDKAEQKARKKLLDARRRALVKSERRAPQVKADAARIGQFRLWDLEPGMCKWPFGERDYSFCGAKTVEGGSYCLEHFLRSVDQRPRK